MSYHLDRQIDQLKRMLLSMCARVEESVHNAIDAVLQRDPDRAQIVIDEDHRVDLAELEVEDEAMAILSKHQPVAVDLRLVIAVLKMNRDLERIGDLAKSIAEQAIFLSEKAELEVPPIDILSMSERVREMLRTGLDALVNVDPIQASAVRRLDDSVDDEHRDNYAKITQAIMDDPDKTEQIIHFLSVSRCLERIADHTVNIAKDVIYMAEGEVVRHKRVRPPQRTSA